MASPDSSDIAAALTEARKRLHEATERYRLAQQEVTESGRTVDVLQYFANVVKERGQ